MPVENFVTSWYHNCIMFLFIFYSRDISKKVLASWMACSRQGKFLGSSTPYGLMRNLNDHGHLIIDPETAPMVKLVFDLALNG